MSFKRAFERNVNKQLQDDQTGGPAVEDSNIKKDHDAWSPTHEEEDCELSAKKDRPPRFSTLFAGAPAPVVVERDPPREKRKSGVFIPMPLFILLAVLLFLMSTFVFAYTIIGLYNNRPAGLLPGGFSSTSIDGCSCADKQSGINIAPNFVMPQAHSTVTVTVTASNTALAASAQTSTKAEANAVAAEVKSMLSALLPSTTTTSAAKSPKPVVVTATPPPNTITSTSVINVNSDGKTITSNPPSATTTSSKQDRAAKGPSVDSAVDPSGGDTAVKTNSPSTKDAPSPTSKDDAKTSTEENGGAPTPCDPLDLSLSCQH